MNSVLKIRWIINLYAYVKMLSVFFCFFLIRPNFWFAFLTTAQYWAETWKYISPNNLLMTSDGQQRAPCPVCGTHFPRVYSFTFLYFRLHLVLSFRYICSSAVCSFLCCPEQLSIIQKTQWHSCLSALMLSSMNSSSPNTDSCAYTLVIFLYCKKWLLASNFCFLPFNNLFIHSWTSLLPQDYLVSLKSFG